jgi:replication initiator protein RepSA
VRLLHQGAEYQRRGLVHLHAAIRLDRRMPAYRASELRAPDRRFTTQLLEDALRAAAATVEVKVPDELGAGTVRWGAELDVEQLTSDPQKRRRKAGYLAKYSTKSTEQAGDLLHPIHRNDIDHANVRPHVHCYLQTAVDLDDQVTDAIRADEPPEPATRPHRPAPATFRHPDELELRIAAAISTDEWVMVRLHDGREFVGRVSRRTNDGLVLDSGPEVAMAEVRAITIAPAQATKRDTRDRRLAACAHTFGYRGHCLTKSRRWSVRFKDVRQAREDHVHEQLLASGDQAQRQLAKLAPEQRITAFEFAGVGHLTTADAYLAAQAAATAREQRELAREALYDHTTKEGRTDGRSGRIRHWPREGLLAPGGSRVEGAVAVADLSGDRAWEPRGVSDRHTAARGA